MTDCRLPRPGIESTIYGTLILVSYGQDIKEVCSMYYYSKTSKRHIIHTEGCCHHHAIRPDHMGIFHTLAEAWQAGYHLCKTCSPLAQMFQKEEKQLLECCRKNGLAVRLERDFLAVATPRSRWRILADENRNRTILYHGNDGTREQSSPGPVPGYHHQHVNYATLQEYLDYIVDHDGYRMRNPLYPQPTPQAAPAKGTKRYRKAQAKEKRRAKKEATGRVLSLMDALSAQNRPRAVG